MHLTQPQLPFDFHPLTAIQADWIERLKHDKTLLQSSIREHGSPINIHHADTFRRNINGFKSVFKKFDLPHRIFFARKANKCIVFPKVAAEMGEGADTASYRELKQCIDAGIAADQLVCTAAVKSDKLLQLAIRQQVGIVVDNVDECQRIQQLAEAMEKTVKIIVRLQGFKVNGEILPSRFGFPLEDAFRLITAHFGADKRFSRFEYRGLHFHLNGYDIEERALALWQCTDLIDQLNMTGITTHSLDFGGGILINYLSSAEQWETFHQELQKAVLGDRDEITYGNDGLGHLNIDGKLWGQPQVYPYYNELYGTAFLEKILGHERKGIPLYQKLRSLAVEMRIEPGRSALDQCGVTVAQVAFRRLDSRGNLLIGLEMNRTQLKSSSADFLVDPVHIPLQKIAGDTCDGYLVGAYCLEQELIIKRKLRFKVLPQVGDLFMFINTAGYMMHFYESEAHLFELAENLIYFDTDNRLQPDQDIQ